MTPLNNPRSRHGGAVQRLLRRFAFAVDRLIDALSDPARREHAAAGVLMAYVLLWTLVGVLAKAGQDIHYDMAGVVAWSRELAFGYPQHPPLAPWLVRAWFIAFPLADWSYYLLAMISAAVALWLSWRLFASYLPAEKRVLGLALLTLIPFYNFHALKFDHNAVLLSLWAATTLCFIRSFETRRPGWAALPGIGAAAAMLAKYWSAVLLIGLALAALADPGRRSYFRSPAPWITVAVGAVILLPHLAWLWANDFSPMSYAMDVHHLAHFNATAISVLGYLAGTGGYIVLPILLITAVCRPTRAAVDDVLNPAGPAQRFAAIAFWTPLLLPAPLALLLDVELNPIWSMSALTLLPIVLLSSPLMAVKPTMLRAVVALAVLFPFLMVLTAPAMALIKHITGDVTSPAAHGRLLAERIEQEWRLTTAQPLRLVGGDLDLANVTAFYLPDRPSPFPISESQLAPWINYERVAREGLAIVCHAHLAGPLCLHRPIQEAMDDILSAHPPGRRAVLVIARNFAGIPGSSARYIIVTIPPEADPERK
jgi:4-amino-4-deoxy-L-arabinose transferase-like glycosyltransferase